MPNKLPLFEQIPTEVVVPVLGIVREELKKMMALYPPDVALRMEVNIKPGSDENPTLIVRLRPIPWKLIMPLAFGITLVLRENFWSKTIAENYAKTLTGQYQTVTIDDPALINAGIIEIPFE